ncbi:MAG: phosphatidylserine/phosphatidylglycerophosphate/cardiolipin synthase family protein [Planctomycetes bacterium]|nr:phosphatidylserine/phosphatidylglycerophosphate/cardiolipin synthase family protein [Planctomycetota bacterium]
MLDAIAAAKSHVHLETYIWEDDLTGNRFREALIERSLGGCAVRVMFDAVGSFSLPSRFVDSMRSAGIELIEFHPVAPWRPRWGLNKRNHKKILVVDDCIGFTGGINLNDANLPIEAGGKGWSDWHVAIEGPAVHDLAQEFLHTWLKSGGDAFSSVSPPVDRPGETALGVQVISNVKLKHRWRMHRAYLWAIRHAEKRIDIMNAYFIPEWRLRTAFIAAVKRGVEVRVIVPSVSDVPAVAHAGRHLHRRLVANGVRIFEWPKEHMMHAKLGIIDGVWTTIGSYNLDHRSLVHNLEVGLVIVDPYVGRDLQRQFESDIQRCTEVTVAALDARSHWQRFLGWFWYQLRSQM